MVCKVVVVMPAYNASKTLERTVSDMQPGSVDDIILCDDASSDETVAIARRLRLRVLIHAANRGYGANQKTCYDAALDAGANIVVMVHPDYQYDPRVIPLAVGFIRLGICDVIVASHIRARREAMQGGIPALLGTDALMRLCQIVEFGPETCCSRAPGRRRGKPRLRERTNSPDRIERARRRLAIRTGRSARLRDG
jgi:glycosyltransferase involved in cell wall biosynthesis